MKVALLLLRLRFVVDIWDLFMIWDFVLSHGLSVVFLRPGGTVKLYFSVPIDLYNCTLYFLIPKTKPKILVKNLAKNITKIWQKSGKNLAKTLAKV